MPAMRPTSVSMPVAVTTAFALPLVMTVEDRSMLCRSPRGRFSARPSAGALPLGRDSPVMALSSALSPALSRMRASAGTMSPASTRMMSPGTSLAASTRRWPSVPHHPGHGGGHVPQGPPGPSRRCSLWAMEMQALTSTMTRMITASTQSSPPPAHRDSPAAPPAAPISWGPSAGPGNRTGSPGRFRSSSTLGPYRPSLSSASPSRSGPCPAGVQL